MTTFQAPHQFRSLPDSQRNPYRAPLGYRSNSVQSEVKSPVSSNSASSEDLLPDLWSEPVQSPNSALSNSEMGHFRPQLAPAQPQILQNQPAMAPVQRPGHYFYQTPRTWENTAFDPLSAVSAPRSHPILSQVAQTSMMRDASLEYAQSLLPHSLLAPLTEENLDLQRSQMGEELFNFEQHHDHKQAAPKLRSRSFEESKKKTSSSSSSVSSENEPHLHKSRHTSVSSTHSGFPKQKNINTQLYKTELCVSYMKMGVCPYGNKCQFAHGEDDLKTVERPANWRSKPCANWAKFGSCRYGKRCCFKHGD